MRATFQSIGGDTYTIEVLKASEGYVFACNTTFDRAQDAVSRYCTCKTFKAFVRRILGDVYWVSSLDEIKSVLCCALAPYYANIDNIYLRNFVDDLEQFGLEKAKYNAYIFNKNQITSLEWHAKKVIEILNEVKDED